MLDLREYDPLDWFSRTRLELAMLEAGNTAQLAAWQQFQTFNLGLLAAAKDENKQSFLARALEADQHIRNLLQPWLKTDTEPKATEATVYQGLRRSWVEAFGDPNDPAVAANIQRTADWLQKTGQRKR